MQGSINKNKRTCKLDNNWWYMFSEKQTKNETIIYFIVIANKNFELKDIILWQQILW